VKQNKADVEKLTKERNQLIISNDQLTKEVEELKTNQGPQKKTPDTSDAKLADYKNKLALLKHEYKKLKTEKDEIEKKYNSLLQNQEPTATPVAKHNDPPAADNPATDKPVSDIVDEDS